MSMMDQINKWRGKDRRRREIIYVAVTHELSESTQSLIEQLIEAQGGSDNTKLDEVIELLKGGNLVPEAKLIHNKVDMIIDLVDALATEPTVIKEQAARIRAAREKLKTSVDKQTQEGE